MAFNFRSNSNSQSNLNSNSSPHSHSSSKLNFHFSFKTFLAKTIHQSYFLVALAVGIVAGVILALIFHLNYFASPVWLAFAILLLVIAYLKPKLAFIALALLAGFILAFFRVASELTGEQYLQTFINQEIIITGTVSGDPNPDDSSIKLKLTNLQIASPEPSSSISATVYLTLAANDTTTKISRSDHLTIKGTLQSGFGTYAGSFYRPTILEIRHPTPADPILSLRNWFAARINSELPEQEAGLGLSYLLGMKTNLDSEIDANLRTVGLVHMVVASGTHLSILVGVAKKIFGKISRFSGLLFASLFILAFMSMIGFTPSILRAGLMSILTLVTWYFGRQMAPWRSILLVAAITLLINPMFLTDLGWLLSFASFAGIMILGPHLTKFFYGDKPPKFVASIILSTVSATLMTLPITLYYFGSISIISILANVLLLPTLPLALGATFATGLVAGIPVLSTIITFITTKLLNLHITLVGFFAAQTNFLVTIDKYQSSLFFLYILIFIPLIIGLIRKKMVKLKQLKYKT